MPDSELFNGAESTNNRQKVHREESLVFLSDATLRADGIHETRRGEVGRVTPVRAVM
jgi:hypothetical protein